MLDQMKKLMEMKKQAEQIKRELDASRFEVGSSDEIKIVIDGAQHLHAIEINSDFLQSAQKESLEQDLLKSFNQAVSKSQAMAAQKMKAMTGLNIPGF